MTQFEKLSEEYADAVKSMDTSVDTDIDSQQRTQRENELKNWDEDQANQLAQQDGIKLTDEHFKVLYWLRDYYLEQGKPASGRDLDDLLDEKFANQGGRKHLHLLFPEGPVAQGMRLAGLPVPAHSKDKSFGTVR